MADDREPPPLFDDEETNKKEVEPDDLFSTVTQVRIFKLSGLHCRNSNAVSFVLRRICSFYLLAEVGVHLRPRVSPPYKFDHFENLKGLLLPC